MIDVLLLCAIPVEWDALMKHFTSHDLQAVGTDPAAVGTIHLLESDYTAAIVEVGVGSVNASLAALNAVDRFNPRIVLFVGIAGGRKDVSPGDVVFASKVHYYESGKLEGGEFLSRPDSISTPIDALAASRALVKHTQEKFRMYVGPIASGEKVVADSSAEVARILTKHYNDALAVEMEGSGYYKAMAKARVSTFSLVRGISDLLDNKTATDSEGWQDIAASNAAMAAMMLISEITTRATGESVSEGGSHQHENQSNTGARPTLSPAAFAKEAASKPKNTALNLPVPDPNQVYALLCSRRSPLAEVIVRSGLPLSLVLDLDSQSDRDGILATARRNGNYPLSVHFGGPTSPPLSSRSSTSWFSVRGIDDESTESLGSWKRTHRRRFRKFLEEFGEVVGGRSINLLVTLDDPSWVPWAVPLLDDLIADFGDQVIAISLGQTAPDLEVDRHLDSTLEDLRGELDNLVSIFPRPEVPTIPGLDGVVVLPANDLAWMQEDIEFVSPTTDSRDFSDAHAVEFLRGGEISWSALENDADVLRDEYSPLKRMIEGVLKNRRTLRVNLYHAPGAGGTTLGRRIVHDLHTSYPCVIVQRYRSGETARRIEMLARLSGLPILCLIDTVRLPESNVGALLGELQATSTSVIIFHVARRYSAPSAHSSSAYLGDRLSDYEADRFLEAFSQRVPERESELRRIHQLSDERRTPFFFALGAFEENFRGLTSYVEDRLVDLPESQLRILAYCSVAHYYGQSGIPEYALGRLVGLPVSRAGGLARLLRPEVRGLLWRSRNGEWRTSHQLVARQVLVQLGGGEHSWRRNLTDLGREFGEFCLERAPMDQDLYRIAEAVYIERGSQELLGSESGGQKKFSRLIEDIPSSRGAVELLSHVASLVPEEAHFAAHVARYYAFILRDFDSAHSFAVKASRLDPDDHVLHHVLGMVLRSRVYDAIGHDMGVPALAPWVEDASREFSQARKLEPLGEYAYISEIQMRVKLIDYAIRRSGSISAYLAGRPDPVVVDSISIAEDLLSRVRYLGDARNPSGYEKTNRATLSALYGDFDRALQLFNSLLGKANFDQLQVRRQIVWTYLARADRNWRALGDKHATKVLSLLEDNLHEGNYAPRDLRQWWRAVRYVKEAVSQDRVHELMAYWRQSERTVESLYCSYVTFALDALDGSTEALLDLDRLQSECSRLSTGDPRRKVGVDWMGRGKGVKALVHSSELGRWDPHSEFWSDTSRLLRFEARVTEIRGPQAGTVNIHGVKAFFVPARAEVEKGRDENSLVTGFVAFSRDGVRMWDVERAQT